FYAYGQSKLANILFTRELAKRLRHSNINTYSLHPGVINTNLSRHVDNPELHEGKGQTDRGWFRRNILMTPLMGSQTTLYCALDDELANESGYYYNNCLRDDYMIPEANDDKTAKSLWELMLREYLSNFMDWRRRVTSAKKLNGQVVVVTGGNTGIGKETAYQLTLREAKVYIGCRDQKRGEAAVKDILSLNPKANIKLLSLDLSSLTSVRKCVEELSGLETKVDILINNAGVAGCPEWQTEDGFEMQFGTNHLGHFLFTLHLIPLLRKAPAGRIVTVSSGLHICSPIHLDNVNLRNGAYHPFFAYAQSKLANVLFSRELAKRLRHSNINTYSLHPGVINTELDRHMADETKRAKRGWFRRNFRITPFLGSQTTLYCTLDDDIADETGYYYDNCRRVDHMIPEANDDKTAKMTSSKNLNGQVVVVTGGNTGIGKETAYQLTLRDAKVYIGCRDQKRGEAAVKDILSLNPKANISLLSLDLSSLTSVRKCVEELSGLETKVDILINNAGVAGCPEWQTEDGKAPAGRIVTVSSDIHEFGKIHLENINLRNGAYHPIFSYAQSKLANVLFSRELAKRLRHSNINTYSVHPGVINTELDRHMKPDETKREGVSGWFRRNLNLTVFMGSQTTLYCALDDEIADETGYYYEDCVRVDHMIPEANDDKTAKITSSKNLNGQVVVVTGGNKGLGKETAYQLTLRDAKVYIGCRDQTRGEAAVKDILSLNPKANIKLLSLDLSSLTSVRKCVEELSGLETKVDILINNACVNAGYPECQTEDGFEIKFGTNHLVGQIHLDNVNLRNGTYHPFFAYAQSKLANVLFSRELAKRLRHSNINTYCLDPGVADTDLSRHVGTSEAREWSALTETGWFKRNFFTTPFLGSQTTLYCALDDDIADETGYYYDNCRRVDHMIPEANDDKTAKMTSSKNLNGQVVVVTGANTGIGKETAYQLTLRDAKVYILCRDQKKGKAAVKDIQSLNPKANIKLLSLDLSSLKSVRKCVEELSGLETKVDILINNAGVMACPEWQTEDGFEMQFGTNHLGHFLFTLHLIPLLKKAPAGRIVNVSSTGHQFGQINLQNINLRNGAYHNFFAYGQSKLANVLFSRELAKRLRHSNINTYSLNPGAIDTDLQRHVDPSAATATDKSWFRRNFFMTPFMGSQTTLYCALDDELADQTGYYYDNCRRVDHMIPEANDDKTAKSLWELSCDLVKLEEHLKI
ncbi:unnamed protein product, partial [Medioppia subpectinata]